MTVAGRLSRLLASVLFAALVAACAGQQPHTAAPSASSSQGYYKVGPPYEVSGVWYYPKVDYHYDKQGVASWYGESYQGRATANGEIYDVNRLTAANPTLPMPSIVRVTNLRNGRSLRLRVNDRGPFVDGRIIDVSRRAAQLLGFKRQGTAPVEVKVLKGPSIRVAELAMHGQIGGTVELAEAAPAAAPSAPPGRPAPASTGVVAAGATPPAAQGEPTPPRVAAASAPSRAKSLPPAQDFASLEAALAAGPKPARPREAAAQSPNSSANMHLVAFTPWYYVEAGAYTERRHALRVESQIAGLGRVEVIPTTIDGVPFYRVRLGPLTTLKKAKETLSRVIGRGYRYAHIGFN